MRVFMAFAALLHLATCSSHVSVRMPYQNPAGVTYVNGFQGQEDPLSYGGAGLSYGQYAAQPLQYQTPSAGLQYQSAGLEYQSPLQYQASDSYAAPTAAVYPAKIETHHVGYAAAQLPAVPFVKHVPTVSNIPVTRYETHQGVIEKQLDVAKSAVSTRKFEVRRPAIQKQFYDIEERVIIRPAGSALVEFDEPISKLQRGPAVLSEAASPIAVAPSPYSHQFVSQPSAYANSPSSPSAIPFAPHAPVYDTVTPVISHAPTSHVHNPSPVISTSLTDEESVRVDNANFRGAQFRGSQHASIQSQNQLGSGIDTQLSHGTLFRSTPRLNEKQVASRGQELQQQENLLRDHQEQSQLIEEQLEQQQQLQLQQQQQQLQLQQQQQLRQPKQQQYSRSSVPNIISRLNGAPFESIARSQAHNDSPSLLPSTRSSPDQSRSNQQKLIDLLTARGGVAEVGFGRDGSSSLIGDVGNVRARVLSVTPTPEYAETTGERVSTRRVVVSKPAETLQEIDVLEPATKFERISVQHPTLFKTAHLDHVQVHGSVAVVGKALASAVAHAAVPVYQKTITPAAAYAYH